MIRLSPSIVIAPAELELSYARSSGPGGQNVNKTNTKALLRWNVRSSPGVHDDVKARFLARFASRVTAGGDVVITSDRHRDQPRNVEDCVAKLVAMLAEVAQPPTPRRPSRPGRAARERRIQAKKARGAVKDTRRRVQSD